MDVSCPCFVLTGITPLQKYQAYTIKAYGICLDLTAVTGWESHPDFFFFFFPPAVKFVRRVSCLGCCFSLHPTDTVA